MNVDPPAAQWWARRHSFRLLSSHGGIAGMLYLLFGLGFVLLIKGADLLIEGGTRLARRFGVSELIVGLTVVAMGTSLPELVVNVFASAAGSSELAIGNVLGSNIANILLILGICAMIRELPIRDSTLLSEIPFALAATLLTGFLANAALFNDTRVLSINRLDGTILIAFFGLFLAYVFRASMSGLREESAEATRVPAADIFRVLFGSAALAFGGHWVVNGAMDMSQRLGVSESLLGLTVVAVGTSLPELAASGMAAYRGKADIAVGNIVGSNIFNLLWVLGLSALIRPLAFDVVSNTDIVMIIFSSTLLLLAVVVGRPNTIERWEGATFVAVYGAYLAFVVVRG